MNAKARYYKRIGKNIWDGKTEIVFFAVLGQTTFQWIEDLRWVDNNNEEWRLKTEPRVRIAPLELAVLGIPQLSIEEIVKDFGKSIGQKLKIVGK